MPAVVIESRLNLVLHGLSHFMVQYRTKEIGVRKVLGASVGNIMLLLASDFVKLILVSVVLGLPIIYLSMNAWLENYASRIQISGWTILVADMLVVVVVVVTVSFETVKAAIKNPTNSLRYE